MANLTRDSGLGCAQISPRSLGSIACGVAAVESICKCSFTLTLERHALVVHLHGEEFKLNILCVCLFAELKGFGTLECWVKLMVFKVGVSWSCLFSSGSGWSDDFDGWSGVASCFLRFWFKLVSHGH
jgi:hypothetical protein